MAPPATEPVVASERLIIFLVGAVQFVNILDFMMVMPLGPDFARALGISTAHLGLIAGSYTAAAAVAGIVGARFLDRFDRRKALGVALFGPGDRHRGGRARAGAGVAGARARDRGRVRRAGDVDRALDHRRRRAARRGAAGRWAR